MPRDRFSPEGGRFHLAEALFDAAKLEIRCPTCPGNPGRPGFIKDQGGKADGESATRRLWACQRSNGSQQRSSGLTCPRVSCTEFVDLARRVLPPQDFIRIAAPLANRPGLAAAERALVRHFCRLANFGPLGPITGKRKANDPEPPSGSPPRQIPKLGADTLNQEEPRNPPPQTVQDLVEILRIHLRTLADQIPPDRTTHTRCEAVASVIIGPVQGLLRQLEAQTIGVTLTSPATIADSWSSDRTIPETPPSRDRSATPTEASSAREPSSPPELDRGDEEIARWADRFRQAHTSADRSRVRREARRAGQQQTFQQALKALRIPDPSPPSPADDETEGCGSAM